MASDQAHQRLAFCLSMALTLRGIYFNGKDWLDYVLAAIGMSATWRSGQKMPQIYWRMMGDVPLVEAGVRGFGVECGKFVPYRQSVVVDSALKSHVVIEIVDTNDPQAVEATDLHQPGDPGIVGTYSISPYVPGDAPFAAGPSTLGAIGVNPYLVVDTSRFCYIGVDLAELAAVKSEHDKLTENVWLIEEERRNFDECYLVLSSEKTVVEAQAATLVGEVNLLSQQGVVQVVDRAIESSEFALGIRRMKASCVATSVENGKQVARAWSVGNGPGSSDSDVVAQSNDATHDAIRAFSETNFASYLRLGELGLADLFQLCSKEDEHMPDGGVWGTTLTQPRRG
ncbi:unnamed protein product [Lactuca saligna]|uniref:Uncharacterized protein n=1 Tax=Lactuca saligna TaxID=75948 RepID=A0AA35ZXU1_LACSI|nr:unnamed protein product [Lactuca saligna]